ncbi:carboxy terminal-processing peptidase [Haliscomenobacter sp.]|uniref:carboxy terminal-processing peptidase n=1 Tax=Haliscomenobacter sp. TaxID=2717303 RepID=UPI0035945553
MKFRGPIFLSVVVAGFLLVAFYPRKAAESAEKDAVLMKLLVSFLNELHFDPKTMDDNFSEKFYTLYLESLDPSKRFLTQEDTKKLEAYRLKLDDAINSGSSEFFDLSVSMTEAALQKTQGYYRDILAQSFDFNVNDVYETDPEKRPFAKNDAELKEMWRKMLKYETLARIMDKEEGLKSAKSGEEAAPSTPEAIEAEARKALLKSYDDWFNRLIKTKRSDRLSLYLNSFTHLYDPHTDFLEPADKQDFDLNISGRLEGIGARLQTVGDYTKVSEVVVGGPAWKGKELQENDLILKAAQGDNGEWLDFTGMLSNEVVSHIRGKKGTKVRLLVKKVDGSTKEITIIRDVVEFEESYVKSLILEGTNPEEKIGYVYLPKFYADFQRADGRFSAPDVAKELEKLKTENVSGVIIDLRNNGGGSLNDVVKMSGFFIESGPIVQVKSRTAQPEVNYDRNPSVQYGGPLVIMVNSFSASASEILAAALQDYGRAVIVGSKSTYGKGTVQRVFSLDQAISGYEEFKPLGDIKITLQKFYRINGGSTQLRGVTPDIVLPDSYHYLPVGEREEDYPLNWTEIPAVSYSQNAYKIKNLEEIKRRSKTRIEQDPGFQKVLSQAKYIEVERKNSAVMLNIDQFRKDEAAEEKMANDFRSAFKDVVNKGVRNISLDDQKMKASPDNEKALARNKDFMEGVSKDIYIRETLRIMHDMIAQK